MEAFFLSAFGLSLALWAMPVDEHGVLSGVWLLWPQPPGEHIPSASSMNACRIRRPVDWSDEDDLSPPKPQTRHNTLIP